MGLTSCSVSDGEDSGQQGGMVEGLGPDVTLSGRVTYDFVPHQQDTIGLDYDAIEERPVRGASVQVISDDSSVLSSGLTDDNGEYSFTVPSNQDVLVRVRAEVIMEGVPSWNFAVSDNTNDNALYVLDGSLARLGSDNQTRNLHADSGWGGRGYLGERAAAPFAILDTVYQIIEKFVEVDPDIQFPPAEIRWSENNVPVEPDDQGGLAEGQITTSSYRPLGPAGGGNIYLLGDENTDTDEYDPHIIVHEWGHYFEDQVSRSDSIGGPHRFTSGVVDTLDMRVAFSEGWGNALSAIVLDDPIVRDTRGPLQQAAFGFDVEDTSAFSPNGWFSEVSVHSVIYDLYDSEDDGVDIVSLGLGPIYAGFTREEYIGQESLTSVFPFLTQLKIEAPLQSELIDTLAESEDINGTGYFGEGENNSDELPDLLPIYKSLTLDMPTRVCSDNPRGEYNKALNRAFLFMDFPPASEPYSIVVELAEGNPEANPEIGLWGDLDNSGEVGFFTLIEPEDGNTEMVGGLPGIPIVLEIFEAGNIDDEEDTGGYACFDVTVSAS